MIAVIIGVIAVIGAAFIAYKNGLLGSSSVNLNRQQYQPFKLVEKVCCDIYKNI